MTDPIFEAVAAALAGQAVTALGTAGATALRKLRELVSGKSEEDESVRGALEAAQEPEAGEVEVKALAERLDQAAAEDPEFRAQLRAEGETIHNAISGNSDTVVNQFTGTAQKVVQARDIHGGISL